MGKAPFQPERSGRFSAGDGTGVEPVKISLGKGKEGVQCRKWGGAWPLLSVAK